MQAITLTQGKCDRPRGGGSGSARAAGWINVSRCSLTLLSTEACYNSEIRKIGREVSC
jgi:hypothetical protein